MKNVIVINRLFSADEAKINLDTLFDEKKVVTKNPDDVLKKMEPLKEEKDISKRINAAWSMMEKDMKEPFPEVERFPIHFYKDGIEPLKYALLIRQNIALEHYKGNKDYNFMDLLGKLKN